MKNQISSFCATHAAEGVCRLGSASRRVSETNRAQLIGLLPAPTPSVPQESAFSPELYFDVLVEVLTYLDKGLGLAGCPVAGMDKHEGGIFDSQAPVRDGTAQHSRRENVCIMQNKQQVCLLAQSPTVHRRCRASQQLASAVSGGRYLIHAS